MLSTKCLSLGFCLLFMCCVVRVKLEPDENNALDYDDSTDAVIEQQQQELEQKISSKVLAILEHYQQEDPIGIPGTSVPDPMSVPPLKRSFPVATMNFKDVLLHGLSKFKMIHMHTDIAKMQIEVALRIQTLLVNGNYTMSTWLSKSAGPFTVILTGVNVKGIGNLAVDRKGRLMLQDIQMDVTFEEIDLNFENLGFMGSVFQGIINSVGTFLFDSIKPLVLSEANRSIRGDINKHIDKIPSTFPNSISPFDMAIAEARKIVREKGFDPYKVEDYNHTAGLFEIHLTHTWLTGLSNFYRNGNITIELTKNGTLVTAFNVGTQRVHGSSHWEIGLIGGIASRAGTLSFWVEHFKVQASLNQSLDTREHLILDDLQLDLGNIQVRCNGAGTADYIIEFAINVLPNLLRYQIMDGLESPLKARIQGVLNTTTIDKIARDKVHLLDEMQEKGFKI